jgi:hypothetical protein
MWLAEFTALKAHLNQAYPERFADPLTLARPEFATTYIFSFLEAGVTRCAREGGCDSASGAVDESIDELRSVLEKAEYEIVCCRHVSHLTTAMLHPRSEDTRAFGNGRVTISNTRGRVGGHAPSVRPGTRYSTTL